MNSIIIGIVSIAIACFLIFLSPQEKNMFGYKSPQQGLNKNTWKWSNKCFGVLIFVGATAYLISSIVLLALNLGQYNSLLNKIGVAYILVSVVITEVYIFIRSRKTA